MKKILTIAGSDSSGGAGIQADLKTFSAHGVYGMSVITAVTAQNTQGVLAVQNISDEIVEKQLEAIFQDIEVDGVKIGMVSQISTIEIISQKLNEYNPHNIILDPVMISKNGYFLLEPEAKNALIEKLIPISRLVTPNIPEAEVILQEIKGKEIKISSVIEMVEAARAIYKLGCRNVLIKGGHLEREAVDVLFDGKDITYYESKRIPTKNTHGTGCTLSSAITANIGLGKSIKESVKLAKEYITTAIEHSLEIGHGVGPTNHFYELYEKAGLKYE